MVKIVCKGHKPSYANKFAAGLDIRSNNELLLITPGQAIDIETKLAIQIPKGHFGMVVGRSGLAFKHQIKLINDIGIIDEDYRGEIGIRLVNEGRDDYYISPGDRVAQLIIVPYIQAELGYVEELDETERGNRGFGSSGK